MPLLADITMRAVAKSLAMLTILLKMKNTLNPRSPYGASKASARHIVKVYRESYNLYAVQGWLFNHEGIRRGEEFVSKKN